MSRRTNAIRLTYVIRDGTEEEGSHRSGINGLLLDEEEDVLYSASRDACVRRWDLKSVVPRCTTRYDSHAGWVHALSMVQEKILVTASSDRCVRFWNVSNGSETHKEQGKDVRRVAEPTSCGCVHTDYAVSLASSRYTTRVVSGGLDGRVVLWDAIRASPCDTLEPDVNDKDIRSVYSLACDDGLNLVMIGSTAGSLKMWDTRQSKREIACSTKSCFVGHVDTVRCVALDPRSRLCLSGSSDRTLRLWDVGTRRCIVSASPHRDSVWCLKTDESFSHAYTGGRDGCVCVTDVQTQTARTVSRETRPVRSISVGQKGTQVWTATDDSTIRCWDVPDAALDFNSEAGTPRRARRPGRMVGGAGACSTRSAAAEEDAFREAHVDDDFDPEKISPSRTIKGLPGIIACAVASDRLHVISKDTEGVVKKWSVVQGKVVKEYGKADFEGIVKELHEDRNVQSWFTVDTGLGTISIHLEPPSCFAAEAYAIDLGLKGAPHDIRVNIGEQVVKSLFRVWTKKRKALEEKEENASPSKASADSDAARKKERFLEKLPFDFTHMPPSIMCRGENGIPWRLEMDDFTGREGLEKIPMWIMDCLLEGKLHGVDTSVQKCTFSLYPLEGSDLPPLKQAKLTAPRILHVAKVKNYVVQKLRETGVDLRAEAGIPESHGATMSENLVISDGLVDILCSGKILEPDMTLATICKYLCKRKNDIELFYCRRSENNLVGATGGNVPV